MLFPTFFLWTSFVIAVHAITRNRYTTYAVGLAVFAFTAYRFFIGEINWVGNWPLWDAVRWSDISVLEFDRRALVLSRVLAVGLAILLLAFTMRFARREPDPVRIIHRLRFRPLASQGLRLAPWALVPLVAGTWLAQEVGWGYQGARRQESGQGLLAQEPGDVSRCEGPRHHPRRSRPRALSRDAAAIAPRGPMTWSTPPTSRSARSS